MAWPRRTFWAESTLAACSKSVKIDRTMSMAISIQVRGQPGPTQAGEDFVGLRERAQDDDGATEPSARAAICAPSSKPSRLTTSRQGPNGSEASGRCAGHQCPPEADDGHDSQRGGQSVDRRPRRRRKATSTPRQMPSVASGSATRVEKAAARMAAPATISLTRTSSRARRTAARVPADGKKFKNSVHGQSCSGWGLSRFSFDENGTVPLGYPAGIDCGTRIRRRSRRPRRPEGTRTIPNRPGRD